MIFMLKSKMKKSIAVILSVLTILSVLVFVPVTADAAATVTTVKQKTYNYYDGVGNHCYANYYMPKINMNTADVRAVNAEIASICNSYFVSADSCAKEKTSLMVDSLTYSTATRSNVVSVLIDAKYVWNSFHEYYVYNVNAVTGKRMNNEEVASAFGTNLSNAKNAVKWTIKDKFYHLDANTKRISSWESARNKSITNSNLNNIMLYAGNNGMHAVYGYFWIAGAESYLATTTVYNPSYPTVNVHGTNNGAQVTWTKVAGVPKYRVYKKVNGSWKKLGDSTGTSYVDKSAKPGSTYYYTVRGIAADGSAFMSGYNKTGMLLKFVSNPVISKLEPSETGLKITWNKISGVSKYRVYFKKDGRWNNIGDVTGNTCDTYCYGSGAIFTYTIRAISNNAKQFLSGYNNGKGAKYVYTPEINSISNTSNGVKLSWNKPTGTEKFRLYRKTGSGSWQKVADTTATSYTDGSARNGTKYSYTVRCISSNAKSFQSYYNTTGKTITCRR